MISKISIITAAFNSADTIADTILSIKTQSYEHFEHIVVDGLSTDRTLAIVKEFADKRTIAQSEKDRGIYDALNKGIIRSTGDIIGFLNADDIYANDEVLGNIARMFDDQAIQAVYGDLVYVGKSNPKKIIRYWQAGNYTLEKLKSGWMPPHPTFYVRRSIYDRLGLFDTSFHIAADYDCMLRFFSEGNINCRYIPEVLVKMRIGGASNRSLINILRKSAEDYRAIRRNHVGGFGTLAWKNLSKLSQFIPRA